MFGGPELLGEALGEADDAEFGRGVGGAERVAEPARRRGHIDDRAAAGGLEHRHRAPRAEELAGQADVDAAAPVGGVDLLDAAGRPGNPGIVDQRVEAAERGLHVGEQAVDVGLVRDVGLDRAGSRMASRKAVEASRRRRRRRTRAPHAASSRLGDREANAGRAGRHQHPRPARPSPRLVARADRRHRFAHVSGSPFAQRDHRAENDKADRGLRASHREDWCRRAWSAARSRAARRRACRDNGRGRR